MEKQAKNEYKDKKKETKLHCLIKLSTDISSEVISKIMKELEGSDFDTIDLEFHLQ